ncbi:MAG: 3-phosphoshikimate 1-carboxyvinyltransferase [Acidimicrobiales bacterium]|nr:3-phosphoshikimate 1-carboxyvinyltransferase [Acidimicrobiales bacterium]
MGGDERAIEPAGAVDATVALPGSKSITNRALICAALSTRPSVIRNALDADDTRAMVEALRTMGVAVDHDDGVLQISAGGPTPTVVSVDARQSGTTSRFLLPVLALDGIRRRLTGDAQLQSRPMAAAFDALVHLGARIDEEGVPGYLPVVVQGPLRGGAVELPGDVSSQFLSGLLLASPAMNDGLVVSLSTQLVSRPYVDMTVAVMRAFGAEVTTDGGASWHVAARSYAGGDFTVEPDASTASYVFAAAVLTGGVVTVPGLHRGALQGDVGFVELLARMGARVRWDDDAVTVAAGDRLQGIDVDMSAMSDTVPTLAVVAACAEGVTTIRNVGFIRHKESDRIGATVAELRRCGVDAEETDDGLVVRPGPIKPAVVQTYDDHRMAMAFAVLGLTTAGLRIADPDCVAKTFPGYWDLLDRLRTGADPAARGV